MDKRGRVESQQSLCGVVDGEKVGHGRGGEGEGEGRYNSVT